jgi:hypothetical protein
MGLRFQNIFFIIFKFSKNIINIIIVSYYNNIINNTLIIMMIVIATTIKIEIISSSSLYSFAQLNKNIL